MNIYRGVILMAVVGFKCPSCGAPLTFSSSDQMMKCEYCSNTFDPEVVKEYNDSLNIDNEDNFSWDIDDTTAGVITDSTDLLSYACSSCGGEIITDKTTSATSCPYCGNPAIMSNQLAGDFKPRYVLPFKLDKEFAMNKYNRFTKGKILLPKLFKKAATVENIKGVYVPFWLFDCKSDGNARYSATRITTWSDSEYNYKKTKYFTILRQGNAYFKKVPVDGSSKMPDEYMEAIEPFDYSSISDFNKSYLCGYFAEIYDEDSVKCQPRANKRIKNATDTLLRNTVQGYNTCITQQFNVSTSDSSVSYALLPVWMLNMKYNDKLYTFSMNGQTGNFVGKLPIAINKLIMTFILLFGLFFTIAYIIINFIL